MCISLLILTGICDLIREFTPNREWYLPFQKFRYKLVKLIDDLLDILNKQDFYFTFDGQTIVLEDYWEIRPEKKEVVLQFIREGKISVGPWYLLPDIWLVGQESLIRNLEYSIDLARDLKIPLMQIGYLPDMFGHSRAIPQLIGDLTNFKAAVVWRGVPPEITTVPFRWKSDTSAITSILAIYLPFGYGNAAALPEDADNLVKEIKELIEHLQPFSPLPIYLLHNGTDHQFPNPRMATNLSHVKLENTQISLTVLDDFVQKLQELIESEKYSPPEFSGELRSPARAHLLQDTYSARMWIKQWNQRVEDLLIHYAEPLNTYTWYYLKKKYPTSFLTQAWKWHLRNQPHDSICGCSIDQTHEEMKFRYSWAESIAGMIIEEARTAIESRAQLSTESSYLVFNPTNCSNTPMYLEIDIPGKNSVCSVKTIDGKEYEVQPLQSSSDVVWEMTAGPIKLRALMKMLPGRKVMGMYVNDFSYFDGEPHTCEIRIIVGDKAVSELEIANVKKDINQLISSKKYKHFHILLTKELKQTYVTLVPLKPWSFTKLLLSTSEISNPIAKTLLISKNEVSNDFYYIYFNKNGSFDLLDKKNGIRYNGLHQFEDWGDRGDEYTFGRLGPEYIKVQNVKRTVKIAGKLFCEILQTMTLNVFQEIDSVRNSRIGKTKIPVKLTLRFYRDHQRIDITTELTNTAKDHRLRICFDLPFEAQHTLTSTHFGFIKRRGDPEEGEGYMETPSGIQPQKRYIRVDDQQTSSAVTLMNQGLPEVELVERTRLTMTLLRSIAWLSRSDFPERPDHAGPFLSTPGAQELNKKYTFKYSFMVHSKNDPFFISANHSESFSLLPETIFIKEANKLNEILQPLVQVLDPNIQISSLRVRDDKIWVTMFNMLCENTSTKIILPNGISKVSQIKIDGSRKREIKVTENSIEISFSPYEIKICTLK